MDANLLGTFFGAITACAVAYNTWMTYKLNLLTRESKAVSEGNAMALQAVSHLGHSNAQAIEQTRVQNEEIASAVEGTRVQNEDIATAVAHVHICVEAQLAELPAVIKEVVPATIKEVVPEAIKEVMPDAIKETLPDVLNSKRK